jgi:hypothetical protein
MEQSIEITGSYRVYGKYTPQNAPYQAEAAITRHGDVYHIEWYSGGKTWQGVGVMQANVLAVAILSQHGSGVIAFQIEQDLHGVSLVGKWAYASDLEVSVETLISLSPRPGDRPPERDDRIEPA